MTLGEAVVNELKNKGFQVFVPLEVHSCFDIAARREKKILLIKSLSNIDSLTAAQANELLTVAKVLGATPLIIGVKSKSYTMEDNIVYERYGIQVINAQTFANVLENRFPEKRFFKGKIVVEINAEQFSKAIETQELSVQDVANKLRVSREAVYQYKKGITKVEFSKAKDLEKLFNTQLIKEIDLFHTNPDVQAGELTGYLKNLSDLGFDVIPVRRGFDAIAKERESLIVDSESTPEYARKKSMFLKHAAEFFESHPLFVLEKRQVQRDIKGVPVIRKKEIHEAESVEDILDLIRKRKKLA